MRTVCYAIIAVGVVGVIAAVLWRTGITPSHRRESRAPSSPQTAQSPHQSNGTTPLEESASPAGASGAIPEDEPSISDGDLVRLASRDAALAAGLRAEDTPGEPSSLQRLLAESAEAASRAIDLIASDAVDDASRKALRNALPSRKECVGWKAALARITALGPRLGQEAARLRLTEALTRLVQFGDPDKAAADLLVLWARSDPAAEVRIRLLWTLVPAARHDEAVQRLVLEVSKSGRSNEERAAADRAIGQILEAGGSNATAAVAQIFAVSNNPRETPIRRSAMLANLISVDGTKSRLRDCAEPYRQQLVTTWSQELRNSAEDPFLRRSAFAFLRVVDDSRALDLAIDVVKSDPDTELRKYLFEQSNRLPTSPRLVEMLVDGLLHPMFDSQQGSALLSLQEHGDEKVLPVLESFASDPRLGASARAAIEKIKNRAQASK